MANVLSRVTKEYRQSVNTPDFPDGPTGWMLDPDVSAVFPAVPSRYWVVPAHPGTDAITEMTQGQKDAVDAAALEVSRDFSADSLDDLEDLLRAYAQVANDESNLHAQRITAILDAIDGAANLAQVKTAIAAIPDVPDRTLAQTKTAVRAKLGS